MNGNLVIPIALLAISCIARPLGAQESEARKRATEVCASCHRPSVEGILPAFPRLAGQHAE
jgi:cytochrome c553